MRPECQVVHVNFLTIAMLRQQQGVSYRASSSVQEPTPADCQLNVQWKISQVICEHV